jgi:putative oxidoreductase
VTLGLLILRLFTGLTLAAHGGQKLFGWFDGPGPRGTAGMFAKLGYRRPAAMALLAGLSELVGGVLFAVGLLTPLAAIAIVVVMLNAIAAVHWANGFFMTRGGYEFNLILVAIAIGVSATGAGRASLDHLLGIEGTLSGLWWAPIVLVVAVGIAGLTDALGREHTTLPGHPAA